MTDRPNGTGPPWSRRSFLLASAALATGAAAVARGIGENGPSPRQSGPVADENQRDGTTSWRIDRPQTDAEAKIQAYVDDLSYAAGQEIVLHANAANAGPVSVEIYRMGWYGGAGGRRLWSDRIDVGRQPPPTLDPLTGTIRAAWAPALALTIPEDWVTGVHLVKLTTEDGSSTYAKFVVRDDARAADFLVQTAEFRDHAYNNWPNLESLGKSLYDFNSVGDDTVVDAPRAVAVTLDRPYAGDGAGTFLRWDVHMIRWLERQGYDVSYSTNLDTHRHPDRPGAHTAFLSIGHDEYWTDQMVRAVTAARDGGTHLAFFGANDAYYQVRLEPDAGRPDRLLVGYKSAEADPEPDPSLKTARFRDIGRPEQDLIGVMYDTFSSTSPAAHANIVYENTQTWPFEGTGARDGDLGPAIIGYEIDRFFAQDTPLRSSQFFLARSPFVSVYGHEVDQRSSIYLSEAGSWVFGAGTIAWSWGLDRDGTADPVVQRLTANLLDEFLDPRHLDDPTPASPDTSIPVATITSPSQGQHLEPGSLVLRGKAQDRVGTVDVVQITVRRAGDGRYLGPDGEFGDRKILSAEVATGEPPERIAWSYPTTLPSGDYELTAVAIDGDGNASDPSQTSFAVRQESSAPTTTITAPATEQSLDPGPHRFAGRATDDRSAIRDVLVIVRNLGSGAYVGAEGLTTGFVQLPAQLETVDASTASWSVEVPELPAGPYYAAAQAVDEEGNRSPWTTHPFTVG